MLIINLIIIIIFLMLAILSRKHFSKYKNVIKAISYWIYLRLCKNFNIEKNKTDLRKINVVSDAKLNELVLSYYINIISICMVVIFIINIACLMLGIKEQFNNEKSPNVIERGDYDEDILVKKIYVGDGKNSDIYELIVYPRQYTEEQFNAEAEKIFRELESDILANNNDLQHIKGDINLPLSDDGNRFNINWESDYPEYILPSGKILFDELRQETDVNLVARIEYLDYSVEHSYQITLIPKEESKTSGDGIGVVLEQIETNSRNESKFDIPDEIEGKKISINGSEDNTIKKLFFLCIFMCTFTVIFSKNNLNKKAKNRDDVFIGLFPSFVNRLSLLLGAGMNIKSCLINIGETSEKNILTRELEYTINQINSGRDEASAYEELGTRIGLPRYNRLMSNISQNLRMGTKDLRILMSDELREAEEGRKEDARKKGEKASMHLLFPMIVLMIVVIVIIMVPAFVSL